MVIRGLIRIIGNIVVGGILGMGSMALCALALVGREAIENVLVFGLALGVFAGVASSVMSYSVVGSDFLGGYTRRIGDAHYRRESGEENDPG